MLSGLRNKKSMLRVKRIKIGWYGISAVALIMLALALRLALILLGWPQHNADESIMGLMGLHIAYRGELPIFFYGQFYMGATEAYLAAAIFRLFGASVITLRLAPLLLFALFLACMYLLTSLLYSKPLALVTLALLGLGSNIILQTELVALGGYPELLAFGALAFLLACWLALSDDQCAAGQRRWRFSLGYALWGLIVGLGIWSDYIFVVFALMSGLLLLLFCWRTILSRAALPFLLAGLVIGLFPLIIFNITNPAHNSLVELLSLRNSAVGALALPHPYSHYPFEAGIIGTLLVSLPSITGAPSLCFDANLILHGIPSMTAFRCLTAHYDAWQVLSTLAWSLGLLLLWAIAVLQTLASLNRLRRQTRQPEEARPIDERRTMIRSFARLALLVSAALFFVQFALSPVAAVFPTNARYLTGLLVSTPAVIAALWGVSRANASMLRVIAGRAILVLAALVLLWGSISVFGDIPSVTADRQREETLMRDLAHINATHIYADYWTCYRIAFDSNETITCVVINQYLKPDYNRYTGYNTSVQSDPHAAYVFLPGSLQLAAAEQLAATTGKQLRHFVFEGYIVLQPV